LIAASGTLCESKKSSLSTAGSMTSPALFRPVTM